MGAGLLTTPKSTRFSIRCDFRDGHATRSTQRIFQLELDLPLTRKDARVGTRVLVRFDHGFEPVWRQLVRTTRQTFLERLSL